MLLKQRYRAIKLIGQGGFGRTFLSVDEDKPSKPRCVIKQFFPQAQGTNNTQKAAKLFEQEAVRLDELGKHPQIPDLLAYFTQDGQQYLVQAFIDGQNLAQSLETEGTFSETQIRDLLKSLLPVLEFIHSKNVIHRDIKPENIIYRTFPQSPPDPGESTSRESQLVLVDFGAAKFVTGTALATTGTVIGSAGYAAPEQAVGKAVFASDLYSLGVTCIHLLTETQPFDLYSFTEATWVWRDYLSSPVSPQLGQVLDKMLETAINRRYQSALQVLNDLNPQLNLKTAALKQPISSLTATPLSSVGVSPLNSHTWECIHTLSAYSRLFAGVRAVAISPDGQTFASGSEDNTIKFWNPKTGQELYTLPEHSNWVVALAFSPDGEILVSGSYDKTIKLSYWKTGEPTRTLSGHSQAVTTVAMTPDGQILASGSEDKTIKLWNLKTGEEIRTLSRASAVYSLAMTPDGQTLVSSGDDETIELWNLQTGQKIRTLSSSSIAVYSLAINPDGQTLALGLYDGNIQLWNLHKGLLLRTLSKHSCGWFSKGVNAVAISPDGQIVASGGDHDKQIKLWDLNTGKLLQTLTGHSKGVTTVAFSPSGQSLISGSYDKTIKIWRYT